MFSSSLKTGFPKIFKELRLRSGYFTLQMVSQDLANYGVEIDPSLLSHWQRGARLPTDRTTILLLLELFKLSEAGISEQEANDFCEAAGMGYLTEQEKTALFPQLSFHKKNNQQQTKKKNSLSIYFTAAIAQKDIFGNEYETIVKTLHQLGHHVYEDTTTTSLEEAIYKNQNERSYYYKKVLRWLTKVDVLVTEVSFPSTLHIGHEVSLALSKKKPVLAFYKSGFEPSFFLGLQKNTIKWIEYNDTNLEHLVKKHINELFLMY